MTTLGGKPNTALLVVDAQNAILAETVGRDGVVANVGGLIGQAHAQGVPVIWIQQSDDGLVQGSGGWQLVPELPRQDGDPLVHKTYGDSFEATDLGEILAGRGVGRLVVTGAQSDACIRATIHGAFVRGYDVTLVGDAHTTVDRTEYGGPPGAQIIALTNLYWSYTAAPGRTAEVIPAAAVSFAPRAD